RIKPGAAEQALDDLRWLGLAGDEGPIVQTQRMEVYEEALKRLQERELIYPCTCTRGDVERAASAPHDERPGSGVPVYPGTCSDRRAADAAALTIPYCWRFRLPRRHRAYD